MQEALLRCAAGRVALYEHTAGRALVRDPAGRSCKTGMNSLCTRAYSSEVPDYGLSLGRIYCKALDRQLKRYSIDSKSCGVTTLVSKAAFSQVLKNLWQLLLEGPVNHIARFCKLPGRSHDETQGL